MGLEEVQEEGPLLEEDRNGSIIDLHVTMISKEGTDVLEEKHLNSFELKTYEDFRLNIK